jgi:hypothetical protein
MKLLLKQIQERSMQAKRVVSMDELLEFYVQLDEAKNCNNLPEGMPS